MKIEIITLQLLSDDKGKVAAFKGIAVIDSAMKIEIDGKVDDTLSRKQMLKLVEDRITQGCQHLYSGIEYIYDTQFESFRPRVVKDE